MASKNYDKEWKIARISTIVAVVLIAVPLILLLIPNLIGQSNTTALLIVGMSMFIGLLILVSSLVYLLALSIFIKYDQKKMSKLSDKFVPAPGLKLRQRSALGTVSFAVASLIFYLIHLIGRGPVEPSTASMFDYRFSSFSVLAGYGAIILLIVAGVSLLITIIMYVFYFATRNKN